MYVFPRYLAGLPGHADPSFDPVAHWPHHYPETGPCQLVVASPDHRIRIGWFGDDYDTWVISAAEDPVSPPRWTARINHTAPPEIVEGLTRALADEWAEDSNTFLTQPSVYWTDGIRPSSMPAGSETPRATASWTSSPRTGWPERASTSPPPTPTPRP